jgi:hypothetical protein
VPEAVNPGFHKERHPEGEAPVVKKLKKDVQASASRTLSRRKKPEIDDEEESILRAATLHLMMKYGSLLVATGVREASIKGFKVWIITVTLRYATGHEGYVGDLLFDGETFTFLTEQAVMDERVRQIAEDPERTRKWNEYRASTLHPGRG